MSSPNGEGGDGLRNSISLNETLAEWGGAAVVFGLIVEVVLTATYRHGELFVEAWGPVLADALIALGVAAEVLFSRRARSKAETLQRLSDEKIAEAKARAAEANQRASEANARAAIAMFELAQLKGPRHFPAERRQAIVGLLKPFSGIRFKLSSIPQDSETAAFVSQLRDILIASGWQHHDIAAAKLGFTSGVYILAQSKDDVRIHRAVKALESVMKACGIVAEAGWTDPSKSTDIEIVVATKKI